MVELASHLLPFAGFFATAQSLLIACVVDEFLTANKRYQDITKRVEA